jgi:hypothetical protein
VRDKARQQTLSLNLPAGLYLLEATGKTGKLSQKLMLQP